MSTKRDEPAAIFTTPAETERPEWALSEQRLPLFSYVDGDGARAEVTMPAKPNPGLALRFLRRANITGAEVAISWLIEEAIGAEGMDTLVRELDAMPDPEHGVKVMAAIGEKVQRVVMGGLDSPKG